MVAFVRSVKHVIRTEKSHLSQKNLEQNTFLPTLLTISCITWDKKLFNLPIIGILLMCHFSYYAIINSWDKKFCAKSVQIKNSLNFMREDHETTIYLTTRCVTPTRYGEPYLWAR
jgi:hypothetical protein